MLRPVQRLSARLSSPGFLLLLSILAVIAVGWVPLPAAAQGATQISTYPALQIGLYDGDVTYAQLARMGNFGIGTFDGMDGEMMALDGRFYQALSEGRCARRTTHWRRPLPP